MSKLVLRERYGLTASDHIRSSGREAEEIYRSRFVHYQDSRQHQFVGAVVASTPSSDGRTADTKTN